MRRLSLSQIIGQPLAWLRDSPLVVKLGSALLLISLPPIALLGYQNLQASITTVRATELRNIELLSETLSSQITQLIADYRKLVSLLSADSLMVELASRPGGMSERERVRARFTLVNGTHPDVELLMLMSPDGVVLESSDTTLVNKNFGFRDYFREAIQGRSYTRAGASKLPQPQHVGKVLPIPSGGFAFFWQAD
jgi:C4-dicarboxylate-specific signal transduction histidine kinase